MPNRLARAYSPYLRQHADNPVDWYPWGDEAFERARREDKPVLLSIGYASCHWCHVMAHESFEDRAVARTMNERFVNVKVDREERPDIDAVYMNAVQAMTGGGGWPLTVVLTPGGEPFFGGTYFPPEDRWGQPAFRRVLEAVSQAWRERRQEVAAAAGRIGERLRVLEAPFPAGEVGAAAVAGVDVPAGGAGATAEALQASAVAALAAAFDGERGGFGGAPKFPPHGALRLLLERPEAHATAMATTTLRVMADGGILDQLGGGFARYSVDADWHVPHFEKMLYDNAQLLQSYAAAFARTGDARFRDVALGIVTWLQREMASPAGGLYSSLDADSAGGEGLYYTWSETEVDAAVGEDAALFKRVYGVRSRGAFEGRNVLRRALPPGDGARALGIDPARAEALLARARGALLAAREQRPRPALDDKVLTSWNGLAVQGLAAAARLVPSADALALAQRVADFARAELWRDGELRHVYRDGTTHVRGLLEDYAYLGLGLLALHRVTLAPELLAWALELADVVRRDFADEAGGFYSTSVHAERLLVRPRALSDAATPSDNAAAAELLAELGRVTGDRGLSEVAARAVKPLEAVMARHPQAFASALLVRALLERPPREVVIVGAPDGEDTAALTAVWRRCGDASMAALLVRGPDDPLVARAPLARGRTCLKGRATAYVCRAGACRLPTDDAVAFERQLRALASGEGHPPPEAE